MAQHTTPQEPDNEHQSANPEAGVNGQTEAHSSAPAAGHVEGHEGESGEGHGEGHEGGHFPEVPSVLDLVAESEFGEKVIVQGTLVQDNQEIPITFTVKDAIKNYQNQFFALFMVAIVGAIVARKLKKASLRKPGRFQAFVEIVVEAFRDLVYGVLGPENGRKYLPYVGSLFFFILCCNLMGIIPFLRSPTPAFTTLSTGMLIPLTLTLGLCTFVYVQFTAVTKNGIIKYIYHLMGEPKGDSLGMTLFMWCLGIFLMFPLHVIGELIKPISLSLRLFGNILGEDILIGVFTMFGVGIAGAIFGGNVYVGFPLQLPFFFLALLTSTVQALVFSLLSLIYFLMVLPHDEGAH